MRTNNFKVTGGRQGHFRCNPWRYGRTHKKYVNWRRLRDNLCTSVRREDSRCTELRTIEKYPLTCREHVNHGIEGHWTILPISEKSWVTRIVIEMCTSDKSWILCRWRQRMFSRSIIRSARYTIKGIDKHEDENMQNLRHRRPLK